LSEFYRAFNHRDMKSMAKIWAETDEVAMSNPLGGIKRGWANIEPVYRSIFDGPAQVYVEFYDYTIHKTSEMFFAVGRERGFFHTAEDKVKLDIRTTRVFKKIAGMWRQVHHHGSMDDPALWAAYREAVWSLSGGGKGRGSSDHGFDHTTPPNP
jgi:ketosteroid isomerase-like protein